jgi:hypothetical protein
MVSSDGCDYGGVMDHATKASAARIGAACLLAVFGLLVMRVGWAPAGAADGASPEAATCEANRVANPAADMELTLAQMMERALLEHAEPAVDPSGWVVLNNRGYNYGPPHPVRIDPELFVEASPAAEPH